MTTPTIQPCECGKSTCPWPVLRAHVEGNLPEVPDTLARKRFSELARIARNHGYRLTLSGGVS